MKRTAKMIGCASLLALVSFAGASLAESPPTEHKGLTVSGQDSLPLGRQIPALEGYQLRVRTVVMAPGGVVKNHDHTTRPGAFYVVSGQVVEHRGHDSRVIEAGETVLEGFETEHWAVNKGTGEATLFVFDIVPVEQ